MKAYACAVILVLLSGSACTSGGESSAAPPSDSKRGEPQAFCPALVDFSVEGALANVAVGPSPSAGPEVVSGPEFARTRELLGELIAVAPPQVEASATQGHDALFTAIADLVPSCVGDQTAQCRDRLSVLRQETTTAAFTDARVASITEVCTAPPYLAGTDECDALALALLAEEGSELPVIQHFDERCR
jgi:hypothetical protein